ncbi:MAG: hypothetical protein JRI23_11480 [Deltaproteobacteria bacterium]|jgi:hypothetical protein|nr:hypothetical protein [Deltaproteobacteria bacterium]MBW2532319.1 hypothetical protein [Deltaproteobacteria bacterium]
MTEQAEWWAHDDDLLVESLHDMLEGPPSLAPVAMEPPDEAPGHVAPRRGLSRVVSAGVGLGLVIGVGLRMFCGVPQTMSAPSAAARLSAPAIELVTEYAAAVPDEPSAAPAAEEAADPDEKKAKTERTKRRVRKTRRPAHRQAASGEEDIYAWLDPPEPPVPSAETR